MLDRLLRLNHRPAAHRAVMAGWLAGWLGDWLPGSLAGWLVPWLAPWLVRSVCCVPLHHRRDEKTWVECGV